MNESKLKLIGKPEEPAQEPEQPKPTFPFTNVQVMPQGVVINTMLAPGMSLGQLLDEATMNAICQQWLQSRKQIQRDLGIIQHVKHTRND